MGQDFRNGFFRKITIHHVSAFRRDFGGGRGRGVGLVDISLPETIQCFNGIRLAQGSEAPGADGGPDEVQGRSPAFEKGGKQEAVEVVEDQPFGPSGRTGQHPDAFRSQALVANESPGPWGRLL